jgi:hypothetical protein
MQLCTRTLQHRLEGVMQVVVPGHQPPTVPYRAFAMPDQAALIDVQGSSVPELCVEVVLRHFHRSRSRATRYGSFAGNAFSLLVVSSR